MAQRVQGGNPVQNLRLRVNLVENLQGGNVVGIAYQTLA